MIRALHVVIPARDEEDRLPRCLASVFVAMNQATQAAADLCATCTVVLDRCLDGSAAVVRAAGLEPLMVDYGVVGAARHSGVLTALHRSATLGIEASETWIACTDADSTVPPHWLTGQIALAESVDAVIGTVEPLGLDDGPLLTLWRQRHPLVEGHHHVHGANLGVRGSTYVAVGGFGWLAVGEDVDFVRRLRAHTDRWLATDRVRVSSSARGAARCRDGFADYLTALEDELS